MTYEYGCSACGHQWEAEQSISEKPLERCPSCGKKSAKRLISGGQGFILKGGGWYSDLYSSAKPKGESSSGGGSTSSTPSTSAPAAGGGSGAAPAAAPAAPAPAPTPKSE